jgi:peptide/nickel transport system substrate-binding protein
MQKRLFGLLASAAIAFAACQGAQSPAPSASAPASQPATSSAPAESPSASAANGEPDITTTKYAPEAAGKTGGTLVLAEWQFPDAINPYYFQAFTDSESFGAMSFDGLVTLTDDLKYYPDLASNIPTVGNGDVTVNGTAMDVLWHLKKNMQWSDGTPITCDDLIATWKWIMDKDNTGLAAGTTGWEDITDITGAGGTDCTMKFGKLYSGYLSLVAPLLPAKYITSVAVKDANKSLYQLKDPTKGVYSGPYIPTLVKTDDRIEFAPNPKFQTIGLGDQAKAHAPYLDQVIFKYYGEAAAMIAGYKAGDFDIGMDLNDADIPTLSDIPDQEKVIHDSLTYELHAFNNKNFQAKFGDDWKTVIKAVRMATDTSAIASGPLSGNVQPSNNFVSPLAWYYKDEGAPPAADPQGAKKLLTDAGFAPGSDGILAKNGKKIELDYCTTTRQVRIDTLTLVASQLAAIGIKANPVAKPSLPDVFGGWNDVAPDTKCNLIHGNYDVGEHAYISPLDPLGGYNVYTTQGNPDPAPHNGQNETRVSIPELDAAYNDVKNNVDFAKVAAAMGTVQDIYGNPDTNTYELPLYYRKDVWLVNPKVHNFVGNPSTASGEWNIADWWTE